MTPLERAILLALAPVLAAGCLGDGGSDNLDSFTNDSGGFESQTWNEQFSGVLAVDTSAAGLGPLLHEDVTFDVPEGVDILEIEASWSCISLCVLDVRILDGADNVVWTGQRGGGADPVVVEEPVGGTWTFQWQPAEYASIGIEGELRLTTASAV